jgi:hypothetical protein
MVLVIAIFSGNVIKTLLQATLSVFVSNQSTKLSTDFVDKVLTDYALGFVGGLPLCPAQAKVRG